MFMEFGGKLKNNSVEQEELISVLSLISVENVGAITAKNLISYCGSAKNVFLKPKAFLEKIPGIGPKTIDKIKNFKAQREVEREMEFIEKHKIKPLYYQSDDFPLRLKGIIDSPILLFYKGTSDLNSSRILSIVGTRKATPYGKLMTEKIVEELAAYQVLVVSGLAYGIDQYAHKAALKNNLPTVGVLGHGLDTMYPPAHRTLAAKMLEQGGLLTEFPSGTKPDRENFPARNRIVAGMCDGLLVVESANGGGALITANIALSYNKDLLAVPGKSTDEFSAGCNSLIKTSRAALVDSAEDIAYHLGWYLDSKDKKIKSPKPNLTIEEEVIYQYLSNGKKDFDNLIDGLKMDASMLSMFLLEMEFKGAIKSLPGKQYSVI